MHQQITFEVKGVLIKGEIRCDFGNVIHFQFFDTSKVILDTGYRSHFIGIDEYPEKRIVECGVEEILEIFELLYQLKPTLKEAGKVFTKPADLPRFAKWREFLQKLPGEYIKTKQVDEFLKPVQLTLF